MNEPKHPCVIVAAEVVVIWSLKGGALNPIAGYESTGSRAQKCTAHGQDAIFCALGYKPRKWDGAFSTSNHS